MIEDNDKFWHSSNENNPNFTISFHSHKLKLSGISLLSCISSNCVYNIKILGSNDYKNWINECTILEAKNYFQTTVKYSSCQFQHAYKHYRLMHNGKGMNDETYFPMYYLELFGDLYQPYTLCSCKCKRSKALMEHVFICIVLS